MFKRLFVYIFILLLLVLTIFPTGSAKASPQEIMVIPVEGTITAGTSRFLQESLEEAINQEIHAIIVIIDTPGGLVDATFDMLKDLVNSPIPVITYVSPRGAIAASAGAFILISGHLAVMAPGTTCGAAMPITMMPTGDEPQPADEKTINFVAGHIVSIAETRNRPEEVIKRFVTENLTLSAKDALEKNVIDFIANDFEGLISQLDGKVVAIDNEEILLSTKDAQIITSEMDLRQRLNHFISNPQVAFLLFLLGVYGIFFGLNAPGTFVLEIVGVIALILALFGLGMFETSTTGIMLVVLSVIFFIAEMITPTFGILTGAGVISLVLGAFFLPVEPMLPVEWFRSFRLTVLGMAGVTAAFFLLVIAKLIRLRKVKPVHEYHGMVGYKGKAINSLNPEGTIKIRGEIWKAKAIKGNIEKDKIVLVKDKQGIVLLVEEVSEADNS